MCLARARRPEHQHVLTAIQERPLQQRPCLLHHLGRQPLQFQRRPALLQRQPRVVQQSLDALVPPLLALPLGQPQQVLLEAQPLLLRLPRQLLVTAPEGWQVQLFQIRCQPLLHVLVLLHRRPPCHPVRRHTGAGPLPPPLPRCPAAPHRAAAATAPGVTGGSCPCLRNFPAPAAASIRPFSFSSSTSTASTPASLSRA